MGHFYRIFLPGTQSARSSTGSSAREWKGEFAEASEDLAALEKAQFFFILEFFN
jgi:hypothetical protein